MSASTEVGRVGSSVHMAMFAGQHPISVEELRLAFVEGGAGGRLRSSSLSFCSSGTRTLAPPNSAELSLSSSTTGVPLDEDHQASIVTVEVDGEMVALQLEILDTSVKQSSDLLKNAEAVILVYSITDRDSFRALPQIRDEVVKLKGEDDYMLLLIGQDSHNEFERKVTREEADTISRRWKSSFFEVSTLTRHNIEEVLRAIAKVMFSNRGKTPKRKRSLPFRLFASKAQTPTVPEESSLFRSRSSSVHNPDLSTSGGVGMDGTASITLSTEHSGRIDLEDKTRSSGKTSVKPRSSTDSLKVPSVTRTLITSSQERQSGHLEASPSSDSHLRSLDSTKEGKNSKKSMKKSKEKKQPKDKSNKKPRRWRTGRKKDEKEKDMKLPVGRRPRDMRMLGQRQTMMKLSERMQSLSTINLRPGLRSSFQSFDEQQGDQYLQRPSDSPSDNGDLPPHMQNLTETSSAPVLRSNQSRITVASAAQEFARMEAALDHLLRKAHLLQYKDNILQAQDLRLADLPLLKEWDLDRLGITVMGHKKKLLKAFQTNQTIGDEADPCYWVMDPSELSLGKRLGGGNFGDVFVGKWRGTTTVAIKQLREVDTSSLQEEAKVMSSVAVHPNVVSLYGVAMSPGSAYLVTEFIPDGPLDSYLKSNINRISPNVLLRMCKDVAAGMDHLHSHRIVHRDLAARNLLLKLRHTSEPVVKVCDFGLSRMLEASEYYWATKSLMPIRWSSPEALRYRKFTPKSDVWSFGVVMWEIFSFGQIPYSTLNNGEVIGWLEQGERLAQPTRCPDAVYRLMLKCWHSDPKRRPTFSDIYSVLDHLENETDTPSSDSASKSSSLTSSLSPPSSPHAIGTHVASSAISGSFDVYTPDLQSSRVRTPMRIEGDESGDGSGSIDLSSGKGRNQGNIAEYLHAVESTSSERGDHFTYNFRGASSSSGDSVSDEGRREKTGSDGPLEADAISTDIKNRNATKTKKDKKSKKDKKLKKLKKSKNENRKHNDKESELTSVGSRGGTTQGSTIEQVRSETTRSIELQDFVDDVMPAMELKFKENLEWHDSKPCHFLLRVGAHVWCAAQYIHIYNAMTAQHIYTIKFNSKSRVFRLAYVNGLVWSCDDDIIRLWDPSNFSLVAELNEHSGMVRSILAVAQTEEQLGGSSSDVSHGRSGEFNMRTQASSPPQQLNQSASLEFSHSKSRVQSVWTCDTNGKIIVWDHTQRPPTVMHEITLREEPISCMCQVGGSVWLGAEKRIYCVDLNTHAMFHWTAHQRTVNDLYHENGVVWSSANDGKIKIWNGGDTPRTVNMIWETSVTASVNCFTRMMHPRYPLSPQLCTGAAFGAVTVWDMKTRDKKQEVGQQDRIKCLLWVEENLTLWSASFDRVVHLWHLAKITGAGSRAPESPSVRRI